MVTTQVHKYLDQELKECSKYLLDLKDEELLKQKGSEEYIFWRLMSKKFRKWRLTDACMARTKKAIQINLKEARPLRFVFPMGAYKLWRLPSSPEADWAEFFNVSYLIRYLAPVAAGYNHGVELTYYLHTLLMERHDNLTREEIQSYVESFERIVNAFSLHLPKNMKISILRDADIYSRDEYFINLEKGAVDAKKIYDASTPEKKSHYHKLGSLNIKWNGKEDWTKLNDREREEKINQGALYEIAATTSLPKVMETIKSDDKILLFTFSSDMFIGIGSTHTSMTKFWTGYGVLEYDGKNLFDRILSPSQLESVKNEPHEKIPVNFPFGTNFKSIRLYPTRFDFTRKHAL